MKFARIGLTFGFIVLILIQGDHLAYAQTSLVDDHTTSSGFSHEDFTQASLSGSSLHADPPELVETTEETEYVREWVTVRWRPDDPIYLYVLRPKRVEKPPVVIYLYDYPAETDAFRDDAWCERVTAGGFAAVGFVPALNGHRYHGVPMKDWFVSQLQESLAKSAHDVQMVLNYLERRGDMDMNRVGIFGVGAGATISAIAASADSRIKVIDLIDPWGDWPTWMRTSDVVPEEERQLYLKSDFLERVAPFDPVAILRKLNTEHVRLVQFGQGSVTPEISRKRIAGALPASGEHLMFATFAEFEGVNDSGGHGLHWIKSQLNREAAPKRASQAILRKKEENR